MPRSSDLRILARALVYVYDDDYADNYLLISGLSGNPAEIILPGGLPSSGDGKGDSTEGMLGDGVGDGYSIAGGEGTGNGYLSDQAFMAKATDRVIPIRIRHIRETTRWLSRILIRPCFGMAPSSALSAERLYLGTVKPPSV